MEEYEVIIIGAGPAGSACARALTDENMQVLVIEKEKLPRHKTCSGVLFGQSQDLLRKYFGLLPPDSACCSPKIIKASDIVEWSREKGFIPFIWELPKDGITFPTDYLNIWRNKFDHWLLQQSGAEYIDNCSIQGFSIQGDKVTVETSGKKFKCSYLIGADGGNSKVRRLLDPSWTQMSAESTAYQVYCYFSDSGSLKEGNWYVFFEPKISDTLCCVHHKDNMLALCIGGVKGRNMKESMEAFKDFLAKNFNVSLEREERVEGCVIRHSGVDLGKGRVILTGEASGFMYLNGEGIAAAIDSGYRAGNALAKALKMDGNALNIYTEDSADLLEHLNLCMKNMRFFAAH